MATTQTEISPSLGKTLMYLSGTPTGVGLTFISGVRSIDGGCVMSGVNRTGVVGFAYQSGGVSTYESQSGCWLGLGGMATSTPFTAFVVVTRL